MDAVAAKLQESNPGFDGQVTPNIDHDVVTKLVFITDGMKDISPVRALAGLTTLACMGSGPQKGKLADLGPLRGMRLVAMNLRSNKISDLSPLQEMPLDLLIIDTTEVMDLSPLQAQS